MQIENVIFNLHDLIIIMLLGNLFCMAPPPFLRTCQGPICAFETLQKQHLPEQEYRYKNIKFLDYLRAPDRFLK